MYTTIRTYYIKPGSGSQLKQRIQELVEPQISGLPGFMSYYRYCQLGKVAEQYARIPS